MTKLSYEKSRENLKTIKKFRRFFQKYSFLYNVNNIMTLNETGKTYAIVSVDRFLLSDDSFKAKIYNDLCKRKNENRIDKIILISLSPENDYENIYDCEPILRSLMIISDLYCDQCNHGYFRIVNTETADSINLCKAELFVNRKVKLLSWRQLWSFCLGKAVQEKLQS